VQAGIGQALTGDLTTSSLPSIAEIDYATGILAMLHAAAASTAVVAALARLRSGGEYRVDASAEPDWGATALAVAVLSRLHVPVPAVVVGAVRSALTGRPAIGDLAEFIAFLQTAGELRQSVPVPLTVRQALVRTAASGLAQVEGAADAVWLVEASDLRTAAGLLGVAVPPVAAVTCARLVGGDGGVRLPGQSGADPQATLAALDVGCRQARVPPEVPHSRAGWPTASAAASALPASAAAVQIAQQAGVIGAYAAPLRREIEHVWLPELRRPATSLAGQAEQSDLRILAWLLGGSVVGAVGRALPVPAVTGIGGSDFGMLLYLLDVTYPSPSATKQARAFIGAQAARSGTPSMIRAAWLELAARTLAEPSLHQRALAIVRSLRSGVQAQGDLSGAAIGMWVEQEAWTPALTVPAAGTSALPLADVAALVCLAHQHFNQMFPISI
jgi:hypothetical protein